MCLGRSCCDRGQRSCCLCSPLGFWWIPVSHSGLLESIFVNDVRKGPASFFCMWLSNFPNIICWRDYLFSIGYSFLLCQRSVDHRVEGPFLGSLFCSIDLCVCFCASIIVSWWSQLCNRAWSLGLWCHQLWFSFSTFLWLFRVFWLHTNFRIICSALWNKKKNDGILIRIAML